MKILLILQIIITEKNYYQIIINIFQKYANKKLENKFF